MSNKDSKNEIILRNHVYDGIEEYDQKLPNWWLFTLYISIVWFVIAWVVYYQLPIDYPDDFEKLEAQVAVIEQKKAEEMERLMAELDDEAFYGLAKDPSYTDPGKAIFDAKCAACHGAELDAKMAGIQLPGVSLVDEEWLYGGNPLSVWKTVREGSPDITKGMIAWKTQLTGAEIVQVTSYVLSKQPPK